jgi:hypothetical protein
MVDAKDRTGDTLRAALAPQLIQLKAARSRACGVLTRLSMAHRGAHGCLASALIDWRLGFARVRASSVCASGERLRLA